MAELSERDREWIADRVGERVEAAMDRLQGDNGNAHKTTLAHLEKKLDQVCKRVTVDHDDVTTMKADLYGDGGVVMRQLSLEKTLTNLRLTVMRQATMLSGVVSLGMSVVTSLIGARLQ